jgi:hypothetical protein
MVDMQTVNYLVAATGVIIAAIFYILNIRETTRKRRVGLTQSMLQIFSSYEGFKRILHYTI